MQFGIDLAERGKTIEDVFAHRTFGVVGAAFDNGLGDDLVAR